MVELIAAWGGTTSSGIFNGHKTSQALAPYALKGGYISLLIRKNRIGLLLGRTMSDCSI